MEHIGVWLSAETLRSRSVTVTHRSAALRRGLDPGEAVILRDAVTGRFYSAVVAEVGFELHDTIYRLEIGTRLEPDEVAEWEAPAGGSAAELTTSDVINLLGELRRSRRMLSVLLADATS